MNTTAFIGNVYSKREVTAAMFAVLAMLVIPGLLVWMKFALPVTVYNKAAAQVTSTDTPLEGIFFGEVANEPATNAAIADQIEFVRTRDAFPASLAVIQKHEDTIRAKARAMNVPEDVALGVSLLENGGSETAVSPAGALGVFQLMPGTARNLGLTVNKTVDERKDPVANINGGITYLKKNYDRFGDWGLSTWAYHAGEGNVAKALKIYAKENHGIALTGIKDFPEMKAYVEKHDITIHKLLSDPGVQKFTEKLNDDSSGYPYKVIATATLFRMAENQ